MLGWLRPGSVALMVLLFSVGTARADESRKPRYPKAPSDQGVRLVPEAWTTVAVKKLAPAELDRLVAGSQKAEKLTPAPILADVPFARRVYLDLVGKLPTAAQIKAFAADETPDKRARLIDKLLAGEGFARHRARFWRDVMVSRATDNRPFVKFPREQALEEWLFTRINQNDSWGDIARALLTSDAGLSLREPKTGGEAGLLLCHTREDGPVERTNDAVRVFLGINLQCAQCHDHPDDVWKRQQFHEMAAFFGKLADRIKPTRQPRNFETLLFSRPMGDYRMPDRDDPKKTYAVTPRFLTGESPGKGVRDRGRRKALAGYITGKENYYFSAAFVNRVWGELMGQAFVMPVDNLGPLQPAIYSDVLLRLAASFRAGDHDIKGLYRLILNSKTYQQQIRMGDSPLDHIHFAGVYPTRLRPEALWDSLTAALGPINEFVPTGPGAGMPGRRARPLRMVFKELFTFDPSVNPEEVEGSVPQALMLMNGKAINAQVKSTGNTMLARVLKAFPKDAAVVEQLYLRSLGRNPTAREKKICLEHVARLDDRGAAYEDILWSLINSAEFRTRR